MFVRGKQIRYVHIPDSVNVSRTLSDYNKILERAQSKYKRGVRTQSGKAIAAAKAARAQAGVRRTPPLS